MSDIFSRLVEICHNLFHLGLTDLHSIDFLWVHYSLDISSSPEPAGQIQSNLVQIILG